MMVQIEVERSRCAVYFLAQWFIDFFACNWAEAGMYAW